MAAGTKMFTAQAGNKPLFLAFLVNLNLFSGLFWSSNFFTIGFSSSLLNMGV